MKKKNKKNCLNTLNYITTNILSGIVVSSFEHGAKNMLEMFLVQHTSTWPNFILIVPRIQNKEA